MDCAAFLTSFYETILDDHRISVTQISVYLSLVYLGSSADAAGFIEIDRSFIMKLSKVGSLTTYRRSLHALDDLGYIEYIPIVGREKSLVRLRKL